MPEIKDVFEGNDAVLVAYQGYHQAAISWACTIHPHPGEILREWLTEVLWLTLAVIGVFIGGWLAGRSRP